MNPTARAAQLHRRARHLRELASKIESTPATTLERLAGDDTWRGHRPLLCRNMLTSNMRQLYQAADDLRWKAYAFEAEAEALEALARTEATSTDRAS